MHLMSSKPQALNSIGPMRSFASNSKKVSTELIEINEILLEFNKYYTEYYKQLTDTWTDAQKKVNLKAPEVPQDIEQIEAFKRIWIDIFDNDFTELFDSGRFGENYGKLVSKELDLEFNLIIFWQIFSSSSTLSIYLIRQTNYLLRSVLLDICAIRIT